MQREITIEETYNNKGVCIKRTAEKIEEIYYDDSKRDKDNAELLASMFNKINELVREINKLK